MRLIDGDALWKRLNDEPWENNADRDEIALPIVNVAPTVDAVIVTRCKDCRYRGLICCPAVHETIGNGLVDYAVDNGYCWSGKPKDDQGMMVNAPTVDQNTKTKQQRSFVDPCKDDNRHDWKKWAVSIDAELNTVTTYRCLKCGETFNIKYRHYDIINNAE